MSERQRCPVCGSKQWPEKIESTVVGQLVPSYVDGVLHCPNDADDEHRAYWQARA